MSGGRRRVAIGGFTLLEVMVAVAILAIAITAIFASEAGAIRVATRARFTTTATLLARCKMAEIEELVAREGLPAVSLHGQDACCEEGDVEGFECEWEISRIVLPDLSLEEPAASGEAEGGQSGLAAAAGAAGASGLSLTEPPSAETILSGAALSGGGDIVSTLALQYVFPILKPQIEEQVRRATVTVRWREGERERSFDVVQYLVAEQAPALLTNTAADQAIQRMTTGGTAPPTGGQPPAPRGRP